MANKPRAIRGTFTNPQESHCSSIRIFLISLLLSSMNILLIKNGFYLEMPATHNHTRPHLKVDWHPQQAWIRMVKMAMIVTP